MDNDYTPYTKPEYYRNRELSWLSFNERVLSEARDKSIPLFERLKFLSITSSNLDEFHMIRGIPERYGTCGIYETGYRRDDAQGTAESDQ